MRNRTVHLLALFFMVYHTIGVEITIGSIIFVNYMTFTSLITVLFGGKYLITSLHPHLLNFLFQ